MIKGKNYPSTKLFISYMPGIVPVILSTYGKAFTYVFFSTMSQLYPTLPMLCTRASGAATVLDAHLLNMKKYFTIYRS